MVGKNELCSGKKRSYVIFWGIVWSFKNNKNLIREKTCNKFVFLEARSSTCSWPMTFVGQEIPICLMRHNSHSPKILSCISKNVLIKKSLKKKQFTLSCMQECSRSQRGLPCCGLWWPRWPGAWSYDGQMRAKTKERSPTLTYIHSSVRKK